MTSSQIQAPDGKSLHMRQIAPCSQVPFTLEPDVPGRFRWVTTYIARWDPIGGWPLDSKIRFVWNKDLKTHDGKNSNAFVYI